MPPYARGVSLTTGVTGKDTNVTRHRGTVVAVTETQRDNDADKRDAQQLIVWDCPTNATEVVVHDDPGGASHFTPMTAWFTTPVADVVARLHVVADDSGRLTVISASFVPFRDKDEADVDVVAAASGYDFPAALGKLDRGSRIRRLPSDALFPDGVRVGDGPTLSVGAAQRIAGTKASRTPERIWREVRILMDEYKESGERGLPTAVAQRLGVTVRTAHRYIAAVRAEDAGVQVRFSTERLNVTEGPQ